jgi:flagellar biosynthesis protein FliQ
MQNIDVLLEPVRGLLQQVGAFMPRLVLAAIVLFAGWLLAKAFRFSVVKALRAINFHVLTERSGIDGFLKQGGTEKDTTDLVGWLAYALAILAALFIACNSLGLTQVTDLVGQVLWFVPRLLVALLVLVFGSYFARFAGNSVERYCANAQLSDGALLGRIVRYAVMVFVILLSVDHLQIGGGLIQETFLILLTGIVAALALAFGIGGRRRAADLIERWFPRDRQDGPR